MSAQADDTVEVLRALWRAEGTESLELDEDFGPQKACRNMKEVTFEGMAPPGTDLGQAWRDRLAREGKLREGGSLGGLLLGEGPRTDDDQA
jgi:hypothetical protein